jgi:uncharacterized cofD-like protein
VRAYPEAVRAILEADVIVAGPGSLFTSVLPNLLVDGIRQAVRASSALRIYACNIATQPGETDGFDVAQHVRALERHVGRGLFPYVLANNNLAPTDQSPELQPVALGYATDQGYEVIEADLCDPEVPWRHDSGSLARQIICLYDNWCSKNE